MIKSSLHLYNKSCMHACSWRLPQLNYIWKLFRDPPTEKYLKNEWGASVRITVRQHNHHTSWIPVPEDRYTTHHIKLRATLLTITNIQEEQVTPNQWKFSMPLREKGSLVEEATKTLYLCPRQSKCQTSHLSLYLHFSILFLLFVLTFDCPYPDQARCCSSRLLGP